jgi:hypothetical protein
MAGHSKDAQKTGGNPRATTLWVFVMSGIYLEIPSDIPGATGTPRLPLDVEVKRRLMAAMYAEEIIGGSASCMLGNIEREMRHHWLGGTSMVPPSCRMEFARGTA